MRAGVPRTLDVICERVLHKEASQHAMPIETAHEIAAALADFLGDSGMAAPLDLAGMHSEPTVSIHRDALATGVADLHAEALAAEAIEPDEAAEATQLSTPAPAAQEQDPEDTQMYQEARQGPDTLAPLQAPSEPAAPPPPFEDPPERPLFASTERRVPAAREGGRGSARGGVGPARRPPAPPRRPHAAASTPPPGAPATPARDSGRSPTRTRPRTTSTPARRAAAGCVWRSWSAS